MSSEQETTIGELLYFGRASIKIKLTDGRVVYVDPYAGKDSDYEDLADLVLVTHQHGDHNQVSRVTLKPEGKVYQCPLDIVPGDTFTSHGIDVLVVDAYNKNHKKGESAGFVLSIAGLKIYHSGDTSPIPEMAVLKDLQIDYALLCMDGFYNMGPDEAMAVTDVIDPKYVLPIHTSKHELFDQEIMDAFTSPKKIEVLPGGKIKLEVMIYDKIVRDRIPEIIEKDGGIPVTTEVDAETAINYLVKKIAEEAAEFNEDHKPEELADLLEVIHGIAYQMGISMESLEALRVKKKQSNGGFENRIVLHKVMKQ